MMRLWSENIIYNHLLLLKYYVKFIYICAVFYCFLTNFILRLMAFFCNFRVVNLLWTVWWCLWCFLFYIFFCFYCLLYFFSIYFQKFFIISFFLFCFKGLSSWDITDFIIFYFLCFLYLLPYSYFSYFT